MALFSRETPEERRLKLQMEHAERMKALEMGRPLAEVEIARARADEVRAGMERSRDVVRAIFTALGPVGVSGVAVGATAIILANADSATHAVLLSVVWICSALVSLGLIASGVVLSGRLRDLVRPPSAAPVRRPARGAAASDAAADDEPPLSPEEVERLSQAFQK